MTGALGVQKKIALEIAWRLLSGGMVLRTLLIKNERAVSAMVSPWDDGELASPRRGEANRIGELYPSKFFSFLPPVKSVSIIWAWFVLILIFQSA